jgi:hypothetical protein
MPVPLGSKTDTGSIIQPETITLGLLFGDLEPLPSPDAINALEVHTPAFRAQKSAYAPIAIAAISRRQVDDGLGQRVLIIANNRSTALR